MTKTEDKDDSWMSRYVAGLTKVMDDKAKMVERGLMRAKSTCPVCGVRDAMQLALAPQRRDRSGYHVRWKCTECSFLGME